MAGSSVTSTLDIIVKADTSGAKALTAALQNAERQAKEVDAALSRSGTTDKFQARLKAIGASASHIEAVSNRWKELAKAEGLAEKAGDWTKTQSTAVKNWENVTVASVRAVMGQERAREIAAVQSAEKAEAALKRQAEAAEAAAKREAEAANRAAEVEERAAKRAADAAEAAAKRQAEIVEAAARREAEARTRAIEMEERAARRQAEMEARLQHRMDEQRQHAIKAQGFGHYMLGGAAMAVSAHGVMSGVEHTVMAGANYQRELVGLQNAGRTPEEIAKIQKASEETVKALPTSTYIDNLKTVKETVQAFGSVDHAVEHLQFMQKTMSVLEAAGGEHIEGGSKGVGQNLAKYFEERMRPAEDFETETKALVPAMVASGGMFNPSNLYAFAQQAKSALPSYSLDFMRKYAPTLIGANGGDRAGTAAAAFDNVITGKARDKKQAAEWMRLGLIDPKEVVQGNGGPIGWKAGAVKGTALAASNPVDWAEQVLIPAMKAKGIDTDDRLSVKNELATLFRNQNSNFWANEITQAQSLKRLHKDAGLYDQVGSEDDIYHRNLTADPTVAVSALKNSLENLMTTVSGPAMTAAAGGITAVAEALNKLAGIAKDHPLAAMLTGGAVAGGALAGSGYMSYQLMNGFGLGGAATELSASAVALDGAAAKLAGGSVASDAAKVIEGAGGAGAVAGTIAGAVALPLAGALATAGVLYYGSDPAKGLAFGGRPDDQQNPTDVLPGIHTDDNAPALVRGRPAFPHTPTPTSFAESDPWANGGRAAIDEQARRSADAFKRDPEAARGRAMMDVDTSGLDQAKQKADEAHAALDGLNASVAPQVNLGALDALIAKANEAKAAIAGLAGAAASAGAATRSAYRSYSPAPAGRTTV